MTGNDVNDKQMRAAAEFLLMLCADKTGCVPSTGDTVTLPWDDLVRAVALYGAIRGEAVANGGKVDEPGSTVTVGGTDA